MHRLSLHLKKKKNKIDRFSLSGTFKQGMMGPYEPNPKSHVGISHFRSSHVRAAVKMDKFGLIHPGRIHAYLTTDYQQVQPTYTGKSFFITTSSKRLL